MTDKLNCGGCGNKCVVHCVSGQCSDPVAVSGNYFHSCALLSGGTVACWGYNASGELGDGSTNDAWAPVAVSGLSGVTAVAAGGSHSCAALSDGTAVCWGSNKNGQLGNGTKTSSSTPVAVAGLNGVIAVSTGGFGYSNPALSVTGHSCALLSGGTVACWGANGSGQLGSGTTTTPDAGTFVTVAGLSGATAVTTGGFYSCALLSDGSVKCWGSIPYTGSPNSPTPQAVPGLSGGVTNLAGGFDHVCALLSGGTVKCWGDNGSGQLGDGTTTNSSTAVAVSGLSGATAIAAGGGYNFTNQGLPAHSCAVLSGGTVQCWGYDSYGELGNGMTTNSPTPVVVAGLSGATAIVASDLYSCALLSDHSVECWGYNGHGELGNGTTTNSPTPVPVAF